MADNLDLTAVATKPPCGQCSKCLDASGEMVELFAGVFRPIASARMVVCCICGNKRCPHAADCGLACTNSNEPGQPGSNYANVPVWKQDGSAILPPPKKVIPAAELHQQAMALYTAPFRVVNGAIFDAADHIVGDDREGVLRVRGWGRLSYLKDGAELQDAVGQVLVAALNEYWGINAEPVDGQPRPVRSQSLSAAEASFQAVGVDTSAAAAKEAEYKAMRIERDALRARVAELEHSIPVLTEPLAAPKLPHPKCDEVCYYHCTEGGTQPPSCIAIAAAHDKDVAEQALAAEGTEGLPPPDFYMSEQHGKLFLEHTDQVDDHAYRWKGVWLAPRYEQNAVMRQKAASYDDLVDRLTGTSFKTVGQAVHAAVQVANLSDELIAGVCYINGMAAVPAQQRVKAVHAILRTVGIEKPR